MTPELINKTLEDNPQAAKLLLQEAAARQPGTPAAELRASVAAEILARLEGPETAVDRMQEEAS